MPRTIRATPADLLARFDDAYQSVLSGVATTLSLGPGVYRTQLPDRDWRAGKALATPFTLEGLPGKTIFSGADVFPLSTWRREGELLVLDPPGAAIQPKRIPFWGPRGVLAHRTELAFVDGKALRPELLETHSTNMDQKWGGKPVEWTFKESLDPQKVLLPGSFGVTEKTPRIYLRPPSGVRPGTIELSVRTVGARFVGKKNLTVRGIRFEKFAGGDVPTAPEGALILAGAWGGDGAENVVIESCQFLWNAGHGLQTGGKNWILKNCIASYNGLSGIGGVGENLIFEGCETSFNVWRAWRGGESGWSYGGVKLQEVKSNTVKNHLALGNLTVGFWYDIHCKEIIMEDCQILASGSNGLMWELSAGPFTGKRIVAAGGRGDFCSPLMVMNVGSARIEDSVLYNDHPGTGEKTRNSTVTISSYTRDDEHARREVIAPRHCALKNCVVVGGPRQAWVMRAENWAAPKDSTTVSGESNALFSQRKNTEIHRARLAATDDYAPLDTPGYAARTGEKNVRTTDPKLRAPEKFDLRLPDPTGRLPQFALPEKRRAELKAFWRWLRVDETEGPGMPPAGP